MRPEGARFLFVQQWLEKAEQDLSSADLLGQSTVLLGTAAFHCQQAVEKALKGFLSLHDRPFRRSHDLTELILQCGEIDGAFASFADAAMRLSPYAADFRYPGDVGSPSPEQGAADLRAAREVVAFVQARIPPAGRE